MRIASAFALCTLSIAFAQTVKLRNVSHSGTQFEAGNIVEVAITGAVPSGTVTVIQNGGAPFVFGTTDSSGNWSITATESGSDVGSYSQSWFVDNVPMTPAGSNPYLPYQPLLPNFTVYANYTGTNDAPQSTSGIVGCGAPNNARHWNWSPVTYDKSGTIWGSETDNAANSWNSVQSRIPFSSYAGVRQDVTVTDGSTPNGDNGTTESLGGDCSACYGYLNTCNGSCFDAAGMFHATVTLDTAVINTAASVLNISPSSFATATAVHELGHALRLGHPQGFNHICSEVTSVMYPSGSMLVGCGITSPTSRDVASINTVYPSVVPTCPSTIHNTCGFTTC